jgi:hypothetical protein
LRGLALTCVIALVAGLGFARAPGQYLTALRARIDDGMNALTHRETFADRYLGSRPDYRVINQAIPKNARVLAAVNLPALLDSSRFEFATLDLPGSVSPPPHMPFFRGVDAKLDYLRSQGFTYVLAQLPEPNGLYNRQSWVVALRSKVYTFTGWARYMLDWLNDVDGLAADPRQSRRFGSTILVKL